VNHHPSNVCYQMFVLQVFSPGKLIFAGIGILLMASIVLSSYLRSDTIVY
jgi:hypothetical protein